MAAEFGGRPRAESSGSTARARVASISLAALDGGGAGLLAESPLLSSLRASVGSLDELTISDAPPSTSSASPAGFGGAGALTAESFPAGGSNRLQIPPATAAVAAASHRPVGQPPLPPGFIPASEVKAKLQRVLSAAGAVRRLTINIRHAEPAVSLASAFMIMMRARLRVGVGSPRCLGHFRCSLAAGLSLKLHLRVVAIQVAVADVPTGAT